MPSSPSVRSASHSTWFHMSRRRQTLLVLSAAVGALLAAAVAAPLHHDVSRSCVQLTRILVTRATPTVFFGRYPVEVDAKNETEPSNQMFVASVDRWHMAFKRLQRDVRAASRGGAWARTHGLSVAILACSIVVLVSAASLWFLRPPGVALPLLLVLSPTLLVLLAALWRLFYAALSLSFSMTRTCSALKRMQDSLIVAGHSVSRYNLRIYLENDQRFGVKIRLLSRNVHLDSIMMDNHLISVAVVVLVTLAALAFGVVVRRRYEEEAAIRHAKQAVVSVAVMCPPHCTCHGQQVKAAVSVAGRWSGEYIDASSVLRTPKLFCKGSGTVVEERGQ